MRLRALVPLVLLIACQGPERRPRPDAVHPTHTTLAPGIVALVGGAPIATSLAGEVARAQRVDAGTALDRLIDDALAAQGAHVEGEDGSYETEWAVHSIEARAVAARAALDTRALGPPTDPEVAELTSTYWRDVDLPEQVKVIHAIVLRPKDPSEAGEARALAGRLVSALATARTDDEFESIAHAFPPGAFEVRVERLPSFVQDGRMAEGDPGGMDSDFVKGAFSLKKPGDTSGIVESPYGWHVIRLIGRLPPKILSLDARRARFADEIYARRARSALGAILSARRAKTPVTVSAGVDAIMATISPGSRP